MPKNAVQMQFEKSRWSNGYSMQLHKPEAAQNGFYGLRKIRTIKKQNRGCSHKAFNGAIND